MWEFCIIIDENDKEIYTYVYSKLLELCGVYDAILVDLKGDNKIKILISCNNIYKQRFKNFIKKVISEVICTIIKKEFLLYNINFFNISKVTKDEIVQALICFDLATDEYIAEKRIDVEGSSLDIRALYYFKQIQLRDKWEELVIISNENSNIFSSEEYVNDFLKFIVENMEYSYELINVVKDNGQISLYDSNFNKLEFTCTEENLIKTLIVCNPKRIAIMNTNDVDKKTLLKLDKIFTRKVVYDQK